MTKSERRRLLRSIPATDADCPDCGGTGYVEESHPHYGSRYCPEPNITVPCPRCAPEDHDAALDRARIVGGRVAM